MNEATPDDEVVVLARAGDREAFAQLYEVLMPMAWRVAWLATADRSASEDIVGEAMLALVDSVHDLPDSYARVAAWLRTVVRNKSVDWVRRQSRKRKAQSMLLLEAQANSHESGMPHEKLLSDEVREKVGRALSSLDETSRAVLTMRYVSDMSCREIADTLELSGSATNSLLYRARIRFREIMKWQEGFGDDESTSSSSSDTEVEIEVAQQAGETEVKLTRSRRPRHG